MESAQDLKIGEVVEDEAGDTGDMETSCTVTSLSASTLQISESDTTSPLLASTVPNEFSHLLEEAIATCMKHERNDIIITYLCNLQATPREVGDIATELKHIAHLQHIHSTFVPIRY